MRKTAQEPRTVALALTVRQPWAALIAAGFKTIENRTWDRLSVLGQRIAIHASKGSPVVADDIRGKAAAIVRANNPRGAIVCTAVVDRFITSSPSPWFSGPIGWVLRDVEPCEPIFCTGALLLWKLPPAIARRLS